MDGWAIGIAILSAMSIIAFVLIGVGIIHNI